MKTVDQLEREYRARRRAAGDKLYIYRFTFPKATEARLHKAQISRSEYMLGLIRKDRPNRARRISEADLKVTVAT